MDLNDKRIRGLSPDMAPGEAAVVTFRFALPRVAWLLDLSSTRAGETTEYVHQLRVATRRGATALRAYRREVAKKQRRKAGDMLRTIRRAAGEARDCDVHGALFRGLGGEIGAGDPALGWILDRLALQRADAQPAIDRAACRYADGRIDRRLERLCRSAAERHRVRAPDRPATLGALARQTIAPLVRSTRDHAREAGDDALRLHALRIECKRLRYTLELFEKCADRSAWKPAHKALKKLLDRLGEMNDAETMLLRMHAMSGPGAPDLAGLVEHVGALRATRLGIAAGEVSSFVEQRWFASLEDAFADDALRATR